MASSASSSHRVNGLASLVEALGELSTPSVVTQIRGRVPAGRSRGPLALVAVDAQPLWVWSEMPVPGLGDLVRSTSTAERHPLAEKK
jgi:hypothetical protein